MRQSKSSKSCRNRTVPRLQSSIYEHKPCAAEFPWCWHWLSTAPVGRAAERELGRRSSCLVAIRAEGDSDFEMKGQLFSRLVV